MRALSLKRLSLVVPLMLGTGCCAHSVFVMPNSKEATEDAFCQTLLAVDAMQAMGASPSIQVTTGLTWAASATTGVTVPVVSVSGTLTGTSATQVVTTLSGVDKLSSALTFCKGKSNKLLAHDLANVPPQTMIRYDATDHTFEYCQGSECFKK